MKVWIWKRISFDAAHSLPDYPGVCSRLHGHMYSVELGLLGVVNESTGIAIDLREVSDFLRMSVFGLFDHSFINEKLPEGPSTAENIAKYVWGRAYKYFVQYLKNAQGVHVKVYETPDSWVELHVVPPAEIITKEANNGSPTNLVS